MHQLKLEKASWLGDGLNWKRPSGSEMAFNSAPFWACDHLDVTRALYLIFMAVRTVLYCSVRNKNLCPLSFFPAARTIPSRLTDSIDQSSENTQLIIAGAFKSFFFRQSGTACCSRVRTRFLRAVFSIVLPCREEKPEKIKKKCR